MIAVMGGCWAYLVNENPGCPEYTIIEELEIDYFMGKWYEMYSTATKEENSNADDTDH